MTTIHASAVLIGARAVLIRGPSGSGKSALAFALIRSTLFPFSRLVGDDRVLIEPVHGRVVVRPAKALAGLIEIRGLGIRCLPHEPLAAVGLVVDLAAADAARLAAPESALAEVAGIRLPRLGVAAGNDALPLLHAALRTRDSSH